MGLGGVAALLYTGLVDQSSTVQQKLIFGAFCLGDSVAGLLLVLATLKSRVVLYPDSIAVSGLFGTRRLLKSEIAGKMVIFTGCQAIVLYPKPRDRKKITVSVIFPTDAAFDAWMSAIPPIDAAYLRARWRQQ